MIKIRSILLVTAVVAAMMFSFVTPASAGGYRIYLN